MYGRPRIDPDRNNVLGQANQDSFFGPEFTFHHGHVEQVITNQNDLDNSMNRYRGNIPKGSVSQCILLTPTFGSDEDVMFSERKLKGKIIAQPLLRGISDSMAKGDAVIWTELGNTFYYLGPINTLNDPNYSPNDILSGGEAFENREGDEFGYSELYKKISVKKANKPRSIVDRPYGISSGDLYSTAELDSIFSDVQIEGRHNNSIQLGTRFINPYTLIKNNHSIGNNGSVLGMLAFGSLPQHFPIRYRTRNSSEGDVEFRLGLSSDIRILGEQEGLGENDYPGYFIGHGNDGDEKVFDIDYGQPEETPEQQTKFDQVIMFSDRITFDAQENDLTVSAFRNINLGSGRNITITNKGFTVIESENIYIGEQAKQQTQPMVLGESLRVLLENLVKIIKNAHALVQGVPIPLVDAVGSPLKDISGPTVENAILNLTDLLSELESRGETEDNDGNITYGIDGPSFFSHHHYIQENR